MAEIKVQFGGQALKGAKMKGTKKNSSGGTFITLQYKMPKDATEEFKKNFALMREAINWAAGVYPAYPKAAAVYAVLVDLYHSQKPAKV